MKVIAVILFSALAVSAFGQQNKESKRLVHVDCVTEDGDIVGDLICTELRDLVAVSPRYREVAAADKTPHWTLHVVSVTIDDNKASSAQSVAFTIDAEGTEYFLYHSVLVTGRNRTKTQAESILAALDRQIEAD